MYLSIWTHPYMPFTLWSSRLIDHFLHFFRCWFISCKLCYLIMFFHMIINPSCLIYIICLWNCLHYSIKCYQRYQSRVNCISYPSTKRWIIDILSIHFCICNSLFFCNSLLMLLFISLHNLLFLFLSEINTLLQLINYCFSMFRR